MNSRVRQWTEVDESCAQSAYTLEGSVLMKVKGKSPITPMPGQTFYEEPDDVHVVARNASHTASAKFLVFFVKDKGAPLLVPAK